MLCYDFCRREVTILMFTKCKRVDFREDQVHSPIARCEHISCQARLSHVSRSPNGKCKFHELSGYQEKFGLPVFTWMVVWMATRALEHLILPASNFCPIIMRKGNYNQYFEVRKSEHWPRHPVLTDLNLKCFLDWLLPIFNFTPIVYAAKGTVNNTGGCMQKGG